MHLIKFSSYYAISNDGSGGSSVKYYDRDGNIVKSLYFSWKKKAEHNDFNSMLDDKLDPINKWKMRPTNIKIYESNHCRTIGFYDKNNNLIYFTQYNGPDTIDEIANIKNKSEYDFGAPIDAKYLIDTQKVIITNNYDSYTRRYMKMFSCIRDQVTNTLYDWIDDINKV
jgi:hypothetical protein